MRVRLRSCFPFVTRHEVSLHSFCTSEAPSHPFILWGVAGHREDASDTWRILCHVLTRFRFLGSRVLTLAEFHLPTSGGLLI